MATFKTPQQIQNEEAKLDNGENLKVYIRIRPQIESEFTREQVDFFRNDVRVKVDDYLERFD